MSFILPAITTNDAGEIRRVGYELEYAGIDIATSAEVLNELLGGKIEQTSPFCLSIKDTAYGTFRLEIDANFLKDEKYLEYLERIGIDINKLEAKKPLEDTLRDIASTVVPCEIVMPPLPVSRMDIADDIVDTLREKKAKGTRASFLYAFGLHINPEAVSTDTSYLLSHIRAFILLFDLIKEKTGVDLSRRITPYINQYSDEYIKKVIDNNYSPNITQLIDDYLQYNPSRNHALDMLPLFAMIDNENVIRHAREPDLVKPRSAFHYRLANSRIDEPGWSIADEWYYWVMIEELAGNGEALTALCEKYLARLDSTLPTFSSDWIETIRTILD